MCRAAVSKFQNETSRCRLPAPRVAVSPFSESLVTPVRVRVLDRDVAKFSGLLSRLWPAFRAAPGLTALTHPGCRRLHIASTSKRLTDYIRMMGASEIARPKCKATKFIHLARSNPHTDAGGA